MTLNKNDKITIEITSLAKTGNGVGRYGGMAVFVPLTAVGDTVEVQIIKVTSSYAVGKLIDVVIPSPDRIQNDCPVFSKCGGCSFRHITYEAELTAKQGFVKDCFEHIGGIDTLYENIVGSDKTEGYRNKAMLPVGKDKDGNLLIGYFRPRSHDITDCRSCALLPDVFNKAVGNIAEYIEQSQVSVYNEANGTGLIRQIYLRMGPTSNEVMVCLVTNGDHLPKKQLLLEKLSTIDGIVSVVQNINTSRTNTLLGDRCITLFGKKQITDTLCGLSFNISPLSFYQINSPQAERLYNKAKEFAEPSGKTVIDLYCGAGTIGLSMANEAKKVIGAEIIPDAIANANKNAEQNNIKNAKFLCADASKAAKIFKDENIDPDVVLLDPPRKGCDESVIKTVCEMSPERVVYISCDPATCARDCKIFEQKGYKVKRVASFDLFPRTSHVESVALLVKEDK